MKKVRVLLLLAMMLMSTGLQAQVPQEVSKILAECSKKMDHPSGMEIDMKVSAGVSIAKMNMNIKMFTKGEKSLSQISMKLLGREIYSESGYDGVQQWEYKKAFKKDAVDTLTISKPAKKPKGDYEIDFDLDHEYSKATLKTKGDFYEITFTNPKDKELPKRAVMLINKKNGYFQEFSAKESGVTMKMTVQKIKIGVNDQVFKFNQNKYAKAKIVRK